MDDYFTQKMADKAVTIRTRKFMTNRLLSRKQFVSLSIVILTFKSFPFSPKKKKGNKVFLLISIVLVPFGGAGD